MCRVLDRYWDVRFKVVGFLVAEGADPTLGRPGPGLHVTFGSKGDAAVIGHANISDRTGATLLCGV